MWTRLDLNSGFPPQRRVLRPPPWRSVEEGVRPRSTRCSPQRGGWGMRAPRASLRGRGEGGATPAHARSRAEGGRPGFPRPLLAFPRCAPGVPEVGGAHRGSAPAGCHLGLARRSGSRDGAPRVRVLPGRCPWAPAARGLAAKSQWTPARARTIPGRGEARGGRSQSPAADSAPEV